MKISKTLADDIVNEMKKIIGKNINYIAADGEIIASTDKQREGTFHQGATIVMQTNKMLIIEYDGQYIGSKKGINLPVNFGNKIIGVIGISGNKEEVEKYGQIIKKMTEILIKEAYLKEMEDKNNEYEKIMLEGILFDEDYFKKVHIMAGNIQEIPIKEDGTVFIFRLEESYNFDISKKVFEIARNIIKKYGGYIMLNQDMMTALVFRMDRESVENLIIKMEEKIKKEKNIGLNIGIGRKKKNIEDLKFSYKEAITSLEWCLKNKENKIFYDDMKLEIILNSVNEKIKNKYLEKVFKNLKEKEIEEFRNILEIYEKNNGSIEKTSKELFIHKNTLQYKLNKLNEKVNLDMRKYKDFAILKIAFMIKYSI